MTDRLEAAIHELVAVLRDELRAEAPPAADRLLTVDQAREALGGIARSTFYLEIDAGRIRTIQVGRRRLVPSSAITEYIAAGGSR